MTFFTLFMGLISTANAGPAGHELYYEASTLTSQDERWEMVNGSEMVLNGLKGGFQVVPNVHITGGWRYGSASRVLQLEGTSMISEDEEYGDIDIDGPEIGINLHQTSLGAKYTWAAKNWLQPYGAAEGILNVGVLTMDDDPRTEGNPNELSNTALSPGGSVSAGLEFLPFSANSRVQASVFLEAGYQFNFALAFADDAQKTEIPIGQLPLRGIVSRLGVGIQF